jgi:sugar/nucleoside kinase (ribokinase family)
VAEAMRYTDVLLPNENEALALADVHDGDLIAACRRLSTMVGLTVVKRGGGGALAWSHGRSVTVPGLPTDPVDTVGAGDSFNAGFLAGWLDRQPLAACLRLANACGSLSTRATGGIAAQPDMATALEALMSVAVTA